MENSTRFLHVYNTLDEYMRTTLEEDMKVSHIQLIDKLVKVSNLFRFYKNDLKEFAELRNAIVHNTHFNNNRYGEVIAEPHIVVVEMYEELLEKIIQPKTAKDIFRKISDDLILTASLDTPVLEAIQGMYDHEFTCIPILEAGKLVGVFSENVLLSLIAQEGLECFKGLKMKDIAKEIDIDAHQGEYFVFCKVKDNIFDLKELFQTRSKKRLEMIFVTGNGQRNEEILGVITAWDLI